MFNNLNYVTYSRDTTHKTLDRLIDGHNKTVIGWKLDHERVWSEAGGRAAKRRSLASQAPGLSLVLDNVGKVMIKLLTKRAILNYYPWLV